MKYKDNYGKSGVNQNNFISRDINRGVRKARSEMPSLKVVMEWRSEYDNSTLSAIMRFYDYKKIKNRYRRKGKEATEEQIRQAWLKELKKN